LSTGISIPAKRTRMNDVTAGRLWDLGVATVTQAYPGFPFSMSVPDALALCTIDSANAAFPAGSIERKLARLFDHPDIDGWHSLLESMSFTAETLFPFYLLVLIESRFNRESVTAIPDWFALDDHVADIPIDWRTDDYHASGIRTIVEPYPFQPDRAVLLASTKVRGRGKTVYCRSSTDNPLDVYALMRYVVNRNRRVISSPHYVPGALWQFARYPNHWSRKGIAGVLNIPLLQKEGKRFVKRHGFDQRHGLSSIDLRRIRTSVTTEAYIREAMKQSVEEDTSLSSPEERVALHQQNDLQTTTTRYLSNSVVAEAKNLQLEPIQQKLFALAKGDRPRLSFESWEQLRDDIRRGRDLAAMRQKSGGTSPTSGSPEKTDMYILSPDGLTYILVCSSPLAPTWPGHEQFVPAGTRCCYFNRCGQCARAIVFRENLPYIARRILDIEELHADLDPIAWTMQYADEYQSWHDILEQWTEREPSDVEDAWRQARSGLVLLPSCMRWPRGNG